MGETHRGRVALITGASSGLGEQAALALVEEGARIVLAARRTDRLGALAERIRTAGGEVVAVGMDVTDEASIMAAYEAGEAAFGTIDTIVANAGINADGTAVRLPADTFDAIHAVNSRGVFLTIREGGRRLLRSDDPARGRVLILASMGGLEPLPGLVAYCSSKASAVMLGRAFAKEWVKRGICVNVLCPGYMLTELNNAWFESDAGKAMISELPRGRLMPLDAVLPLLRYLTSDAAAHITGSVIKIDDGQLL